MSQDATLLIAGASYAGVQLAASARAGGFAGKILLVGDELHAPYQRPPLSKGLMTGKSTPDALHLKSPAFYAEEKIELILGKRVDTVCAEERYVTLDDGTRRTYDYLVIATGARCRPLNIPGDTLKGVYYLRSLDHALDIQAAIATAHKVCVIGGGFIGLELAAALAQKGLDVTVVEASGHVLSRALPASLSQYIGELHAANQVTIRCNAAVREIIGEQGRVRALVLSDGTEIACDVVMVGIGVVPNDDLAVQAGAHVQNGIVVDGVGRTSIDNVFAVGDVAAFANPFACNPDMPMRLESIQACNDLARAAASAICGVPQPYNSVPWFWSDQFDMKLQMAGLPAIGDEVVMRGAMEDKKFTLYYVRQGRVVAAHSINKPADHMHAKKMIAAHTLATAAQLADVTFDLKSL